MSRITQGSSIEINISLWGELPESPGRPSHPLWPSPQWELSPPLQDWGQSHFQWPICLQTGHGPGGSFWHSQAQWLVDSHLKHSPLLVLPPGRWLNFLGTPWVVLRLQGTADSCGPSLAWAGACPLARQFLSSSSAWSQLLSIPKATSRSWGIRLCGPNCASNFGADCCLSRGWLSGVEESILVNVLKALSSGPWKRDGFSLSSWVTPFMFS